MENSPAMEASFHEQGEFFILSAPALSVLIR
jgi:hypothetical protein